MQSSCRIRLRVTETCDPWNVWNDWNEERKPTWRFHSANWAAGRTKRTTANAICWCKTRRLLVAAPLGVVETQHDFMRLEAGRLPGLMGVGRSHSFWQRPGTSMPEHAFWTLSTSVCLQEDDKICFCFLGPAPRTHNNVRSRKSAAVPRCLCAPAAVWFFSNSLRKFWR